MNVTLANCPKCKKPASQIDETKWRCCFCDSYFFITDDDSPVNNYYENQEHISINILPDNNPPPVEYVVSNDKGSGCGILFLIWILWMLSMYGIFVYRMKQNSNITVSEQDTVQRELINKKPIRTKYTNSCVPVIIEPVIIEPVITDEQKQSNTLAINEWMDNIVVPIEKEPTPVLKINDRVTIIMKDGKKYHGVVTEINFEYLMLRSIENPKRQIGLEFSKIEAHQIF